MISIENHEKIDEQVPGAHADAGARGEARDGRQGHGELRRPEDPRARAAEHVAGPPRGGVLGSHLRERALAGHGLPGRGSTMERSGMGCSP